MNEVELREAVELVFSFRPDDAYSCEEILKFWNVIGVTARRYEAGERIFSAGDPAVCIAHVVKGGVHLKVSNDIGENLVLNAVRPGEFLGLPHLYTDLEAHFHDAVAYADTVVALMPIAALREWRNDARSIPFFNYLGYQLCKLAERERTRAMILSGSTIADKIRRYLAMRVEKEHKRTVEIPGTFLDFADYLSVNHCAMSRVLGQMRKAGIIRYRRTRITLLK